ncbi:AAA family ATPase [Pectobacterium actinidiae]|uniref:AAA family ATPase n=1 Tax=Pectobacterium actinidiae TaxID=1507808 RepID=UPI004040BC15
MKILQFTAFNVYGHINFNINFNKDVSFLVGANGSGKSTAIKLIQAMFCLNFKDLISIPFERIEIVYEERYKVKKINAHKDKICLLVKIDGESEHIKIPKISNDNYLSEEYNSDYYIHIERELLTNLTYKRIRSITPPVFLGLDRKSLGLESDFSDSELSISSRKEMFSHRKVMSGKNRPITGSLSEALLSVQLTLQEQYRKIREFEDRQGSYLRDSILKSSFKFSSFLDFDLTDKQINWENKRDILKRREEITDAVRKIGSSDKSLITDIGKFFDQVERLFQNLSQSESLSIEWLLNKAQIDRISEILEVIDDYNEKTEKMYSPINNFLQVMNSFFVDSKKKVEVDTVGRLFITRTDGKKCNIDILSSGERQLLVLIANVMLNKYTNISRVIIIDEPEISLHLKWQEKFSETILAINPETQFILATHSPDIVGEMTDKCLKVGV